MLPGQGAALCFQLADNFIRMVGVWVVACEKS